MRVVIGNNPAVDSDDVPVMLKLSPEDVKRIASKPENHSIVVFHPHHWPENQTRRWANSKVPVINGEVSIFTMDDDGQAVEVQQQETVSKASSDGPQPDTNPAVEKVPEKVAETKPVETVSENPSSTQKDETTATDDDILNILGIDSDGNGRTTVDLDVNIS